MRKLSCKIFNEFYIPELPRKDFDYGITHDPIMKWSQKWFSDFRTFERNMEKPKDLDPMRNYKYYPPHPQIRELTGTLRDYGLYRDEHRDFNEAIKAAAIAKGKVYERKSKSGEKKSK